MHTLKSCRLHRAHAFFFLQLLQWWNSLTRPINRCRNHRGLRAYWGLRIKGQHTKTTGRRGKTVGVAKKH